MRLSVVVAVLAIWSVSCASARPVYLTGDDRIYIVENGRVVDKDGKAIDLGTVEGWYLVSPATMYRLAK